MDAKTVFGIDLGTTYSCIARVDEHGKPVVMPNLSGSVITPSVVYFEAAATPIAGKDAKDAAKAFPDLVVATVKRKMGDPTWVRSFHGIEYRPQEISAVILKKVIGDAEQQENIKIEDVVITCPAYFGNVEREATRQAGILAGLNVRYIVTEPMAAAFAYGVDGEADETVMVYDLGGGTFDITLLRVPGIVLATDGDKELGGADWDSRLANFFAQKFEEATGVSSKKLTDDKAFLQELLLDAENCKIVLSAPSRSTPYIVRVKFGTDNIAVEVTREEFDRLTQDLLDRTIKLTKNIFERAREQNIGVNKILLVGGSTFMPQVENRLKAEFPTCTFVRHDPNQAVAKGAAIIGFKYLVDDEVLRLTRPGVTQAQAQEAVAKNLGVSLRGVKKLNEIAIRNVTAKSFGLEVVNQAEQDVVQNLVKVDDPIPATMTRQFHTHSDQQEGVLLKIMQNVDRVTDDGEVPLSNCEEIGRAELQFERPLARRSPIEVTFSLSSDGLLKVDARDLTTQRKVQAEFKSDALLSKEELEKSRVKISALQVT